MRTNASLCLGSTGYSVQVWAGTGSLFMRRFFGSSSVARRIPPAAPSFVKEVPIPRTAKTTEDVARVLGHEIAEGEPTPVDPAYLASVMPAAVGASALAAPEGTWYHIERSRAGNLPVYLDFNNAGGVWTEVRKVSGSAGALRNDLKAALELNNRDLWVKNAANSVVLRGDYREKVKALLKEKF